MAANSALIEPTRMGEGIDATALAVSAGAWRAVALTDDEYAAIVSLLDREPAAVELGMFGAMWSEHCGYKHSRHLLRRLPTEAAWVLQGPGENAGAIDVGDGLAVVFKVESHNHPSAVEPYQGAATGVGGIVRDIFTMGARPIALLDGLRFGSPDLPKNRHLFEQVVAGIGGYGNCLGIPTVGGDLFFDAAYDGNPLVNAMCVGVVEQGALMRARAEGVGNAIVLIGAETGRDGLHGATFASVDDPSASHRGVIQVGNPFLEKLLLEACLELLAGDDVVAMQDLGAAGLTSSLVECASRGGVGAEIDVASVPRRETGMTAYEVMLSESQERMLLVVRPEGFDRVREIVERWSLRASVIGTITDDGRVRIRDAGQSVADVPAALFTDACPSYEVAGAESPETVAARELDLSQIPDLDESEGAEGHRAATTVLLRLLADPNIGSRRPVFEQYDHTILTNTVVGPGLGDAAVIRLKGTARGLALALDCPSRYCALDPELGARHAVAAATRSVACVGGRPLALTNCLNFGNPTHAAGAYQLERAVVGIAAAASALGTPVVSGNVSLYNETADAAVLPTPLIGAVGVLDDVLRHATLVWQQGDELLLLGEAAGGLGASEYLASVHGLSRGRPPALDLDLERRLQQVLFDLISTGIVRTAHDCASGGLAVAIAKMAIISRLGASVPSPPAGATGRRDEQLFGESGSRVIVAVDGAARALVEERCRAHDVGSRRLGTLGGSTIVVGSALSVDLGRAAVAYDGALTASL